MLELPPYTVTPNDFDATMIPPALSFQSTPLTTAKFITGDVASPTVPRVSYGPLRPMLRASLLREQQIACDEHHRFAKYFMSCVRCLTNGAHRRLLPEAR